jgi:hypothetical protein
MDNNLFKHKPLEAEARIVQLERELAALRAASDRFRKAWLAYDASYYADEYRISYNELLVTERELAALLGVQDESE